jgi:hypothetical protein
MMLGCCHCPGDSTPPSDSTLASSGSAPPDNTNNCSVCVVAPRRFRAFVNHQNGATLISPCCSSYDNTFILTNTGGCVWESDELALYSYLAPGNIPMCTTPSGTEIKSRFALTISGSLSYSIIQTHYTSNGGTPAGTLRYTHRYNKTFSGSSDCFATRIIPWSSEASVTDSEIAGITGTLSGLLCGYGVTMSNFYVELSAI